MAERDGRLQPGDQLLSVNNEDLRNATQDVAAALLKVLGTSMRSLISPLPSSSSFSSISTNYSFYFFQRIAGRVVIEIARLKPGTSSRPSSMSSLQNLQPGTESMSSMENVLPPVGFGKEG